MLINEFAEDFKHSGEAQFYGINGSICAPSLPCVLFSSARARARLTRSRTKLRPLARALSPLAPSRYFECQGETVLATFDFAQRRSTMTSDLKARPFAPLSAENVPSL